MTVRPCEMHRRTNVRRTSCLQHGLRMIAGSLWIRGLIHSRRQHVAIAMEAGSETTLPLPQEEQATLLISDDEPRQLIISADTRESVIAAYLDNWKRRIEGVGDSYLPQLGLDETISGSPTLMVAIRASGDLAEAVIRKSSGSTVLDLAALDILQRASPFDPFPPEVSSEYDVVRFEYKWLFTEQHISSPPP